MAKRMNPGRGANLPVVFEGIEFNNPENATIEIWTVYDRGTQNGFRRWKLSAQEGTSVLGTANYTINVKGDTLYTNDDGSALRKDRPGLFAILNGLAAGEPVPIEPVSTSNDPYGDDAMSRGQKLTQLQNWNRALLNMRRIHLEWESRPDRNNLPAGVVRADSWSDGIRQSWFGVFRDNFDTALMAHKQSITTLAKKLGKETGKPDYRTAVSAFTIHLTVDLPQEVLDDATTFITKGTPGEINYDEYLKILKAFHDGAYHPRPMETLSEKFDQLCGIGVEKDFEAVANYDDLL